MISLIADSDRSVASQLNHKGVNISLIYFYLTTYNSLVISSITTTKGTSKLTSKIK